MKAALTVSRAKSEVRAAETKAATDVATALAMQKAAEAKAAAEAAKAKAAEAGNVLCAICAMEPRAVLHEPCGHVSCCNVRRQTGSAELPDLPHPHQRPPQSRRRVTQRTEVLRTVKCCSSLFNSCPSFVCLFVGLSTSVRTARTVINTVRLFSILMCDRARATNEMVLLQFLPRQKG
jgi:hypothetical protein